MKATLITIVSMALLVSAAPASAGGLPTTGTPSVVHIAETSATVEISLTPNGLPSTLDIQLGEQREIEAHGWAAASHLPPGGVDVGAGSEELRIDRAISGLAGNAAYELRVSVTNELGTAVSAPVVFRTPAPAGSASSSGLPDGRVYELVSAVTNVGEPYDPPSGLEGGVNHTSLPFQASNDGETIMYAGEPDETGGNGETGPAYGNQWLARRGSTGWTAQDITPAGAENSVYQAFTFSEGLPSGYLEAGRENLTSGPLAPCRGLYATTSGMTFTPLFMPSASAGQCSPLFAGASAGDSTVIFQAEGVLTPEAQEAEQPSERETHSGGDSPLTHTCMYSCNLYAAENGRLTLVNKLDGKDVPNANFGGFPLPPLVDSDGQTDFSNVISRDGSRIYWTDTQEGGHKDQVFMFSKGQNVAVSEGQAQYWTATSDGRYAFYTEDGVLKRFDAVVEKSVSLTPNTAGVLGVLGLNETGENEDYLYFIATGVLANNKDGLEESARGGEPNLYVMRKVGSNEFVTTYVATLNAQDDSLRANNEGAPTTGGDWRADLGMRTSEVSPDGASVIFESVNPLTGYENMPESGTPVPEVFIYSAPRAQLSCISCAPNGERPVGEGTLLSALPISSEGATYEHRWMSDNGDRAFFDSQHPLLPQVGYTGEQSIYEWEREGEGSCSTVVPARALGGCINILSYGDGLGGAFLVESDASGNNVFFLRRGGLGGIVVPNMRNELYDARVAGGFAQVSLACTGTGCQGAPPAPPIFATPASVTFAGTGNFSAVSPPVSKIVTTKKVRCTKGRKRTRHNQCAKNKKKAGTKKASRAAAGRRASR